MTNNSHETIEPTQIEATETPATLAARQAAHDYYTQEFHLTDEWQRATDEKRAAVSASIAHLKGLKRELGDRP